MDTQTIPRSEWLTAAQKALATSAERAKALLTADGYTIEPYEDRPGVYSVARSADDPRPLKDGETLWNDVDVPNQECTCAGFRFRGGCKHLIATNKAIAEAARLLGPMLSTPAQDAAWPPVDGVENQNMREVSAPSQRPRQAPRVSYGSAEWKARVAADFG